MSHRRSFIKQLASIAGASGLSGLLAHDEAFSEQLPSLRPSSDDDAAWSSLRDRYLLAPEIIYLNHGSIGTTPRIVHEAHVAYLRACESNPWLYMWGGVWDEPRENVREKAAHLLGCTPAELAITHNTTEGFNTLAAGLDIGPGDEVLFSSLNHPGASICWRHYANARGFSVKTFDFPILDAPSMSADDVLEVYDRHIGARTRVLAFPHIDNTIGLRYPVKELAALAKSKGVEIVAVDGAQSLGMIDVDVTDAGVDVYSASPHKWLQSPKGLGLFFVRREIQQRLRPMWVTWGQTRWEGTARVFEDYGTRNLAEVITLGDAIDFQLGLGVEAKLERYRAIWDRFLAESDRTERVIWRSPRSWERSASLFAIEIRDISSQAVFDHLNREDGFVFRPFQTPELNTIRISPNVYNSEEEIDRFFTAVQGLPRS